MPWSNKKKIEFLYLYIMRRADEILQEYQWQYQNQQGRPLDQIDYLELILAKQNLDLFNELERDIINIIGDGYYGKK